jgi:hypothetical protein
MSRDTFGDYLGCYSSALLNGQHVAIVLHAGRGMPICLSCGAAFALVVRLVT